MFSKVPNTQIVRWKLQFEEFYFTIGYTKGTKIPTPYQELKSILTKMEELKPIIQYMKECQFSLKKENDNLSLLNNLGDDENEETDVAEEIETEETDRAGEIEN